MKYADYTRTETTGFRPGSPFIEFLENNINDVTAEFYIPNVVDSLIKSGKAKVKVLKTSEHWFGITYKEDKPNVVLAVRKLIEKGFYPEKLF